MAIRAVKDIVHSKLPFLLTTDDPEIESYRVEMAYLLQTQTGKADVDVEAEANYKSLENMLFASMVSYHMAKDHVVKITGGIAGAAPSTKVLKKAKADVVETEFQVVKASDGALFTIPTEKWFLAILKEICDYSRTLAYANPLCFSTDELVPDVAFIIGSDFPADAPNPESFLTGTIQ